MKLLWQLLWYLGQLFRCVWLTPISLSDSDSLLFQTGEKHNDSFKMEKQHFDIFKAENEHNDSFKIKNGHDDNCNLENET